MALVSTIGVTEGEILQTRVDRSIANSEGQGFRFLDTVHQLSIVWRGRDLGMLSDV